MLIRLGVKSLLITSYILSMKKLLFLSLLIILMFGACQDEDRFPVCGNDEISDIPWFKEKIKEFGGEGEFAQYQYVLAADYQGGKAFIFGNCCPFCLSVFLVYDCNGNELGYLGSGEGGIPSSDLMNQTLIWKAENSACNFE